MTPSDQTIKLHIVLITAALALVGFFLEIGPVGGAFLLVSLGLTVELPALGFLPYLALAGAAAVGLHLTETEPLPKEQPPMVPGQPVVSQAETASAYTSVRPELHQMRMLFTAMGGYVVLKSLNLALMAPNHLGPDQLVSAFEFGFIYVALGWFILWQFLRWTAQQRRWIRLQEELVGADVSRFLAVVILAKPVSFFVITTLKPLQDVLPVFTLLLNLAIIVAAILLWYARPETVRRTITGLLAVGGSIIVLTIARAVMERRLLGI